MFSPMNDLIERIEAATGPDRETDAEIAAAVGAKHGREAGWANNHNGDYYVIEECAARYTESVDAALTLVPEWWTIFHFGGPFNDSPSHATVAGGEPITFCEGEGATPSLAICAAALKSRAYLKETNNAD